jgi:hypothetical protein
MMWGYKAYIGGPYEWTLVAEYTGPVPPKPWLPPELGGPKPTGIKLDGPIYEVMIPIEVGCNLISCPVHPMLCTNYYCEAYGGQGIPMDLLFGKTSATDCIEAIWWYCAGTKTWYNYIPGVSNPDAYFKDGVGYWIKAEKPCTLEISGVIMENAPFTPPEYPVGPSWNLMGFTSIYRMTADDYLESLSVGPYEFYGPIWLYNAYNGVWTRNPSVIYPTQAFWMYYKANSFLTLPTLAP